MRNFSVRKYQIIRLVRKIIKNSSLSVYANLWSASGFTITLNYLLKDDQRLSTHFSETPTPQQVSEFHADETRSEVESARKIVHLIDPILRDRRYEEYFDLWARAGFHVTPVPPQVENPAFKPNLFLLGAAKSGTTTLYAYLSEIPGVCLSFPKEPVFFEAEYELGLEHYRRRYFAHWKGEPIIGEARHRNLYLPFIASRIFATNPEAKLIVCLRNPIERAYSHWWHGYARKYETLDFEQAITEDIARIRAGWNTTTPREIEIYKETLDYRGKGIYRSYVDSGYYYEQIERYLKHFPANQLKVVLFEDLQRNPFSVVCEIESFLGIEYHTLENFSPKHENPHRSEKPDANRKPMSPEFRAMLVEHYQPHNDKLARYLGKDLSHWR